VNIDDALTAYRGELIASAQRWQKARARRRHRIALATSALAVAGIIVGTAIAATGWLVGSPAPKNVKSDFGSYAPQLGFNPEPGKAVLVARHGPYKMYVTPDKQGGYCTLIATPHYHPGPHGSGGDCGTRQQAAVSFSAGPVGPGVPMRNGGVRVVVAGRTRNKAATHVRFTTPDGKTATAPIGTSGFFITDITSKRQLFNILGLQGGRLPKPLCHWTTTFVLLDSSGRHLTHRTRTFGPRICLRPPKPIVKITNGTTTFILVQGMVGYLAKASPRDHVACRGSGHALTLTVPEAAVGTHRRTGDRRLHLNIRHTRNGRIWVMCA
jgi:hypothetical protein